MQEGLDNLLHRVPRHAQHRRGRRQGAYPAQVGHIPLHAVRVARLVVREVYVFLAHVAALLAFQPLHLHAYGHGLASHRYRLEVSCHRAGTYHVIAATLRTIKHAFLRFYMQDYFFAGVFCPCADLLSDTVLMV